MVVLRVAQGWFKVIKSNVHYLSLASLFKSYLCYSDSLGI
jgi:hypothetical protein